MKTHTEGTHIRLAAKFEDLEESEAGWTFRMWAQFYNIINDRAMLFFPGSFAKTIRERVTGNRVKIHNGHNRELTACETIGRVLEADETPRGCRYTGFLGRPSELFARKIADETIDENSVEVVIIKADRIERPLEEVPDRIRPWVQITPEGLALITGIREASWLAVGLTAMSSQDRPAVIEAPTAISFQDLPVSLSAWDPDAAAVRLSAWAGEGDIVRLSRGHLAQLPGGECFGQIADIEDGRLVVVAAALEDAGLRCREALSDLLPDAQQRLAFDATAAHLRRYAEKISLAALTTTTDRGILEETGAAEAPTAPTGGAEPPPGTPAEEPPVTGTHSDEGSEDAAARLAKLVGRAKLQQALHRVRRGVRTAHGRDPERTSAEPTRRGAPGLG